MTTDPQPDRPGPSRDRTHRRTARMTIGAGHRVTGTPPPREPLPGTARSARKPPPVE
jgi:hypothetical protein